MCDEEEATTKVQQTPIELTEFMRSELQMLDDTARSLIVDLKSTGNGEAIAQATLAMRHIEDARMRYGKVIQYLGDGVSIYDKK